MGPQQREFLVFISYGRGELFSELKKKKMKYEVDDRVIVRSCL